MEWLMLLSTGLVATIIIMFICWLWAVKVENFAIIDAVWAFSFFVQGIIFYALSDGFTPRKALLLIMIALWSSRLGFFLARRIYSHHPAEDTRYIHLRKEYGNNFKIRFLYFYFLQALSVSFLTLPFIFVFNNEVAEINYFEIAGCIVWFIAVSGETLADHQMNTFRRLSKAIPGMGRTCNIGLWKYSRHPNYFFESIIWWGFFIFMMGSGVYWGVYSALIILFLLLKVTGVPPSEEQALKNRGDEYRVYQRKTSMFIPWFHK